MKILLLLAACTDKGRVYDSGDLPDTGIPPCGRIRGTDSVLMYQGAQGDDVHSPTEPPDASAGGIAVAGPVGDDRTFMLLRAARIQTSADGGCNWEDAGALAASEGWSFVVAGARVYAFDSLSEPPIGARSDDLGLSWATFSTGENFIGVPTVDPADTNRLRGVQSRGIVTTSDGGDTFSVSGALPPAVTTGLDGAVSPTNLDTAALVGSNSAWITINGGTSWNDVRAGLPVDTEIPTLTVSGVAFSPAEAEVLWMLSETGDAERTISRTVDGGVNWARQVDTAAVALATDAPLWPVDSTRVLSTYGTNPDDGASLYVIDAGAGTHTVTVQTYAHIRAVAVAPDRWVTAVDGIAD